MKTLPPISSVSGVLDDDVVLCTPCEWVAWNWQGRLGWSRIDHAGVVWRYYGPLDEWARERMLQHFFGDRADRVATRLPLDVLQQTNAPSLRALERRMRLAVA